jgi:DNA-nicking Smr family endonuclease
MRRSPERGRRRVGAQDIALFRDAVRGARPIKKPDRTAMQDGAAPPPVPVQSLLDAHDALKESLSGPIDWEQLMETGEELVFLRPGLSREILRRLRRGHWVVQDHLDLHGMNSEQARNLLTQFLQACSKRDLRCIRIVHGKGLRSRNREPVLKNKVRVWLARRDDVLAFCQAPTTQGGGGALLVLLKG